jgi:hypothetical protein
VEGLSADNFKGVEYLRDFLGMDPEDCRKMDPDPYVQAACLDNIKWARYVALNPTSGAELLVSLGRYVDKEVKLIKVTVYAAENDGAFIMAQGARFRISWEGADRETMRDLLENCHSLVPNKPLCEGLPLIVTPSGKKMEDPPHWPILINVSYVY